MIKNCKYCGKEFKAKKSNQQFCSRKCVADSLRGCNFTRRCKYCGKEFQPKRKEQYFCSQKCGNMNRRGTSKYVTMSRICENCGKEFNIGSSDRRKNRFCSKKCSAIWRGIYNKGSYGVMSEQTKKLNSEKLKQQWQDEEFRNMVINRMKINNPSSQGKEIRDKQNRTKIKNNSVGFTGKYKKLRGGNGKLSPTESLVYDFMLAIGFKYNYAIGMKELKQLEPDSKFANNYKPDFTHLDKKICIELDGHTHNSDIGKQKDIKKEYALNFYGYSLYRFSNEYVINNLDLFKKDILNIIGYKTANVSSVEYAKSDDIMYDIEVEHNNNYFANGILVHNCKNPQSQQGKGLLAFDTTADRIGMTGTLLVNNPYDLYTPMLFTGLINYNKWVFEKKFVMKDDWGRPYGYKNMEELHEILYKSSIRRTKDLLDLPEKIYKREWLEFSKEEQDVFNAVVGSGNVMLLDKIEPPMDMLAVITRMRQCAITPELLSSKVTKSTKFDRLNDILDEARFNGQKVLVFCPFTQAIEIGAKYCEEYHPKIIKGGMGAKVQETIDEHENTEGFSCIFAQEQTLGAGFTLINTEIVVFLSPPWNKSNYDQCVDRIHRIGQKKTVQVIDLLMLNTFDEIVNARIEGKGAMGQAVIDGEAIDSLKKAFEKMGVTFMEGDLPQLSKLF